MKQDLAPRAADPTISTPPPIQLAPTLQRPVHVRPAPVPRPRGKVMPPPRAVPVAPSVYLDADTSSTEPAVDTQPVPPLEYIPPLLLNGMSYKRMMTICYLS